LLRSAVQKKCLARLVTRWRDNIGLRQQARDYDACIAITLIFCA